MDQLGRLIIPAELRKDGKDFVGDTFAETGITKERVEELAAELSNRHERRKQAAQARKAETA